MEESFKCPHSEVKHLIQNIEHREHCGGSNQEGSQSRKLMHAVDGLGQSGWEKCHGQTACIWPLVPLQEQWGCLFFPMPQVILTVIL